MKGEPKMSNHLIIHLKKYGIKRYRSEKVLRKRFKRSLSAAEQDHWQLLVKKAYSSPNPVISRSISDFMATPRIAGAIISIYADIIQKGGERVTQLIQGRTNVLDVGCGLGYLTAWYALNDPNRQVLGVDFSENMVIEAQNKAQLLGIENVQFECLDISQNTPTGTFDAIVATQCLGYLEDPFQVVCALSSCLVRGGLLVSVAPLQHCTNMSYRFEGASLDVRPTEYLDTNDLGVSDQYGVVVGEKI
jgi:2-polyprenyl-3-methyl-5-hydroxy-6-metoxy-1,4-benzoquinol methylase